MNALLKARLNDNDDTGIRYARLFKYILDVLGNLSVK